MQYFESGNLNPGTSQYEDRCASDVTTAVCEDNIGRKKFLLPGKIKGDLHKFDVAESKYGHQNAASPATFNGEWFKNKNCVLIKRLIYV
jgi:hypothetical protein